MQVSGRSCPMEAGFDPSPRYQYRHSLATLNMGLTAENLALRHQLAVLQRTPRRPPLRPGPPERPVNSLPRRRRGR